MLGNRAVDESVGGATRVRDHLQRQSVDQCVQSPRFDLDVAFLDGDQRVVKVVRLNRGRVTLPVWSARSVVEAEAGSFREWGLRCGDELEVR